MKKNIWFYGFLGGILAALVFLALSFILPAAIPSTYYEKSLRSLKKQSQAVRTEFAALLASSQEKHQQLLRPPFSEKLEDIMALFRKSGLEREIEGVSCFDPEGRPTVWLGNVIDLDLPPEDKPLIVREKASVYLVLPRTLESGTRLVFFRLLAFLPQFKTPYLREYHFLKPELRMNCHIDYWDFREDSGFGRFFDRHKDEYISQPRLRTEIQTIFFPLRDEARRIVATVNLSSPSLLSSVSARRETMTLAFTFFLALAAVFLVVFLGRAFLLAGAQSPLQGIMVILSLAGLRLAFFPLSRLEKIQSLPVFSPAAASFRSLGNLTMSPADIFLTSLFLFFITGCLALFLFNLPRKRPIRTPKGVAHLLQGSLLLASLFFIRLFQQLISRLVFNSNVNLLHFTLDANFLLLHLSLLLFSLAFLLACLLVLRGAALLSPGRRTSFSALVLLSAASWALSRPGDERIFFVILILQTALLASLLFSAFFPHVLKKKETLSVIFLSAVVLLYASLHGYSSRRNNSLLQDFLKDSVTSQERWADFLIRQAIPEIDKKNDQILAFLKNPGPSPIAQALWENTLLSRFNWHSGLEVLNPGGEILSRFALNIPLTYRPVIPVPETPVWSALRFSVPFLGKEKDFVLAQKEFLENGRLLGKIVLYLSFDHEMLPFLYSANPYYELLRVSSLPSLNGLDFRFAVFDARGKLVFNPNKISTGLSPDLLSRLAGGPEALWTDFRDKGKNLEAFFFRWNDRIYALFLLRKDFIGFSVEFLKLLFLNLFFLALPAAGTGLFFRREKWKGVFWSFSNRVYASFLAITLTSLLLLAFFARNFFSRVFTQGFIEKAEIHATIARNIMDDFLYLQKEEIPDLTSPPEDLVLWISTAIANDVSLYREGHLASSSRAEFFDSGLLPELLDGEIFYRLRHENEPFSTGRQKIGNYSFQTLTIPYALQDAVLFISLPFPFERQEISRATQELAEFLVFVTAFFIALAVVFARGLGMMIIAPVKKLLVGTREVSLGNLEISIEHKHQDEMKTLIDGFNAMVTSLKRHQQELTEMSKKVAWAEMARKVAHEIKNPLTPIQLSAEHLLKVYEDKTGDFGEALKESASYIINEVQNLRKIAQEFLEISKETPLRREKLDFKDILKETISPYQKMLQERITIRESYEGDVFFFEGDRSKVKIALRNIVINAIEAIRGKGLLQVRLHAGEEFLSLTVEDTGPGMAKDILDRIFEPYFSTKVAGTGLGLPMAKKIIEDHGGSIRAESEEGRGTTITIRLPRV